LRNRSRFALFRNDDNRQIAGTRENQFRGPAVAYNNTAGALDNLEQLVISIMAAMPAGYEVGDVQRPTIQQVGATNLLVADLAVSTYYTQQTI